MSSRRSLRHQAAAAAAAVAAATAAATAGQTTQLPVEWFDNDSLATIEQFEVIRKNASKAQLARKAELLGIIFPLSANTNAISKRIKNFLIAPPPTTPVSAAVPTETRPPKRTRRGDVSTSTVAPVITAAATSQDLILEEENINNSQLSDDLPAMLHQGGFVIND